MLLLHVDVHALPVQAYMHVNDEFKIFIWIVHCCSVNTCRCALKVGLFSTKSSL